MKSQAALDAVAHNAVGRRICVSQSTEVSMTSRSTSRSRKLIAGMRRMPTYTFSTPGISPWTWLRIRSQHWRETLPALHVDVISR